MMKRLIVFICVLVMGACNEEGSKEVEEVKILAGVTDILIKVRTENIDELNNFVINKLREIEGVDKTQTMIVLNDLS